MDNSVNKEYDTTLDALIQATDSTLSGCTANSAATINPVRWAILDPDRLPYNRKRDTNRNTKHTLIAWHAKLYKWYTIGLYPNIEQIMV